MANFKRSYSDSVTLEGEEIAGLKSFLGSTIPDLGADPALLQDVVERVDQFLRQAMPDLDVEVE